jgi:hypothetical protein
MGKVAKFIAVGLLLFAAMLGYELHRRSLPPPELADYMGLSAISSNDAVSVKMQRFAEQAALDAWRRYHIRVHIGIHSLPDFDHYLELVSSSKSYRHSAVKDQNAEGIIAGAFVGEAIRRTHGGTWLDESEIPNAGLFPLRLDTGTIYPINWCIKRLANGPEDNIYQKYSFLVLKRTNEFHGEVTLWTNTDSGLRESTNRVIR